MQLTQQEIQNNIVQMVKIQTQNIERKTSFCRFYLRGLCIFEEKDCHFSHGVHDLIYKEWKPEEIIEYDYLKATDFNQKETVKGPRIYKNLFEFQKQKIFTLEELNENRQKRVIIRKELHTKLFIDFMNLLEKTYPEGKFTEEFLIRQYTRGGFNKLMTRIKFSHLTTFLSTNNDNQYFQMSMVMPPHMKHQTTFLIKKAQQKQIDQFYRNAYDNIIKEHQNQTIDQGKLKKLLFNHQKDSIHIPPLNLHLKDLKISFSVYLRKLLGQKIGQLQIKFEADISTLFESAQKFLQQNSFIEWNQIYKHLAKQHQINNANVLNQVKPLLALQGYRFLFFPIIQFIVHKSIKSKIDYQNFQQCPCNFKTLYTKEELSILTQSLENEHLFQLEPEASFDIFDIQTLIECAPSIMNSKILAVDIQGRLRKNGYIEMIQLNNENNTFLIDIFRMDLNGDIQAFELSKKLLRNVLANNKIMKIFHDCRHDSLALHEFLHCCIVNVYDTSATQTYRNQLILYEKIDQMNLQKLQENQKDYEHKLKCRENKAKQAIAHANNVKTPGLNEILKIYNAPHGINKNKQLFHSMWGKGQTSLFDQRPLNPDFREYCIKDVLDLPHCYFEMIKQTKDTQFDLDLAKWISSQYVKYGYLSTEEGEEKK